jgi:ubiquinone/menaquinone biosynthesis C-methylase UbiE
MPAIEHPEGATPRTSAIKADLVAFYDARAGVRTDAPLTPDRTDARRMFGELVVSESRPFVVDVGAGTGQDAAALREMGVPVLALDLSFEHGRWAVNRGVDAVVADLYQLPIRSRSVPALWSASTFMHVPNRDIGRVVGETSRVLQPGAPAMIGVRTGSPVEETRVDGEVRRFYSIRPGERWLELFGAHLTVERWWIDEAADRSAYLWLLARSR